MQSVQISVVRSLIAGSARRLCSLVVGWLTLRVSGSRLCSAGVAGGGLRHWRQRRRRPKTQGRLVLRLVDVGFPRVGTILSLFQVGLYCGFCCRLFLDGVCARSLLQAFHMEIFEIPTMVLLEEMLKKLQLPIRKYNTAIATEGMVVASVTFYPAVHCLDAAYGTILLGILWQMWKMQLIVQQGRLSSIWRRPKERS